MRELSFDLPLEYRKIPLKGDSAAGSLDNVSMTSSSEIAPSSSGKKKGRSSRDTQNEVVDSSFCKANLLLILSYQELQSSFIDSRITTTIRLSIVW